MKNIFKTLAVGMLAIMAIACTNEEGPNKPANSNQLATPEFNCNVVENTITVNWAAVDGVAYYEIGINNKTEKTDKTVHRFEDLKYDTTYTITLQAISTIEANNSEVATRDITIGKRVVPAYREWIPQNGSAATAISDNGRWVVGCFDRQGMIIDLNTDEIVLLDNFDCLDVADDGVIVGATYEDSQSGEAALYINGKSVKLDLSELTTSDMSSFQAVTPDGTFAVGWWWEFNAESYYGKIYDTIVPFVYDVLKDRVTVLEPGDTLYGVGAVTPYGVTADHRIIGCEQGYAMMAVLWEDEYSKYTYPVFEYDSEYRPTLSLGDTQVRMTPNGKYIYSVAKTYPEGGGEVAQPGCYNLDTKELTMFGGKCFNGTVTAMTDDGVAFLNDVPFYIGTTSYVVDLKSGDTETQKPIVDWLLDEYGIDLYNYIQEGVITIGASADGRKLLGIVNTDMGWITYVIDLDGEAMPEI